MQRLYCFHTVFILILFSLQLNASEKYPADDTLLHEKEIIPDSSFYIIEKIKLQGNKVTKDHIIKRELEFRINDTLRGFQLQRDIINSKENLLNTSLFNFVFINTDTLEHTEYSPVIITLDFIERWYIWPLPIIEIADRNFNVWWETKDFSRLNYGVLLEWHNFRGRKEKLNLLLRFGYDERYRLFYEIPYINKKQTIGLGLGLEWLQKHEIAYITEQDIVKYYKSEDSYPRKHYKVAGEIIYRPDIHNTHVFEIGYHNYNIADTILKLNPFYSINGQTEIQYMSLFYKYKSDFRDYKPYPLNGYYFDVIIDKSGLGIIPNNKTDVFKLQSTFRKYWKIANRLYFASLITAQFSSGSEIPYYLYSGLGYGRIFVRGYELYVASANNFGLYRSNLKFALIPTRMHTFKFLPTEKFSKIHYALYLNAFFDAAYAEDDQYKMFNTLTNQFLYGTGIGLDFVTYYDIVIRLEYSINKMGETGIFIHFMAPV